MSTLANSSRRPPSTVCVTLVDGRGMLGTKPFKAQGHVYISFRVVDRGKGVEDLNKKIPICYSTFL